MKKSGLLFVLLMVAIFVFKMSATDTADTKKASEDLVALSKEDALTKN